MILVTVGSELPFDRLVRAVWDWASNNDNHEVFYQCGIEGWKPPTGTVQPFVQSERFRELIQKADVVVAHAGIGSILTALELGTPVVVMPRRAAYRETRNDHQVDTAGRLGHLDGVFFASDESEVSSEISKAFTYHMEGSVSPTASTALLEFVRRFIGDSARQRALM